MALARTKALRRELVRSLPSRPFTVKFWDGAEVPSTSGDGPTFVVRSPKAVAHAVATPGQLGLGRAYAIGLLEVDDLDRVIEVLDGWDAPPLDRRSRVRLALAALRATGLTLPRVRPGLSCGRGGGCTAGRGTPAPCAITTTCRTTSSRSSSTSR